MRPQEASSKDVASSAQPLRPADIFHVTSHNGLRAFQDPHVILQIPMLGQNILESCVTCSDARLMEDLRGQGDPHSTKKAFSITRGADDFFLKLDKSLGC